MIDILVCDDSAEIVEQVKKLLCSWERENSAGFNIDCANRESLYLTVGINTTLHLSISRCPT